jgi:hypothetical protein
MFLRELAINRCRFSAWLFCVAMAQDGQVRSRGHDGSHSGPATHPNPVGQLALVMQPLLVGQ